MEDENRRMEEQVGRLRERLEYLGQLDMRSVFKSVFHDEEVAVPIHPDSEVDAHHHRYALYDPRKKRESLNIVP